MGDVWLAGMAEGAATSKRTVQYCMPYPNQVLSAAAYPAVTNARATGDYFHADNQGLNSLEASSSLIFFLKVILCVYFDWSEREEDCSSLEPTVGHWSDLYVLLGHWRTPL